MSNEQKAAEIARKNFEIYNNQGAYGKCCALDAMQWKDEQFAKEKQQWVEKAWDWLTEQKGERTIDDFKKAMEE